MPIKCIVCKQTNASFNVFGLKPRYCVKCKEIGMVNVSHKMCVCGKKRPHFNMPGLKAKFCPSCKCDGMVNVLSKKCFCGKSLPSFNLKGMLPMYCVSCKSNNMINVKHRRCVCGSLSPAFNYPGEKQGVFCSNCKNREMVNVTSPKCLKCKLVQIHDNRYDGYCFSCFKHTFPNDTRINKYYHLIEQSVISYITNLLYNENTPPIVYKTINARIYGGCSSYRPDYMVDICTHVIIIEIDQDQHKAYNQSCENVRIQKIHEDIALRPLVVIRFNPDSYKSNNEIIRGCWGLDGRGLNVIKHRFDWNNRLEILKGTFLYWLNNIPENIIEIVYLFYDE
jgi:hypothetical protein